MIHFSSSNTDHPAKPIQTCYSQQDDTIRDAYNTKQSKNEWIEQSTEKAHTKDRLKKRMFTVEEDNKIRQLVKSRGEKAWKIIAAELSNRSPRQCRERWKNYLSPDVLNLPWTSEEDEKLAELMTQYGAQWAKIARYFHARTDVNVKNRWSYLKRKEKRLINTNSYTSKHNKSKEDNSTGKNKNEPIVEDNQEMSVGNNFENYNEIEKEAKTQIDSQPPHNQIPNTQYGMTNQANEQLIEFWDSNWESLDDNLSSCI